MSEPWKDLDEEQATPGVDDGLPQDHGQDDANDARETVIDAEEFDQPKKKKGPNPKIIAGVMAVACLGALGFFGWSLASKFMPSQERTAAKPLETGTDLVAETPAASEPAPLAQGTTIMGSSSGANDAKIIADTSATPASAVVEATVTPQLPVAAPVASPPAVVAAAAPVAAEPATAAPVVAKPAARTTSHVVRASRRSDVPEGQPAPAGEISTQPARVDGIPGVASPSATHVAGSSGARHRSKSRTSASEVITEAKVEEVPPEIKRLQLRGVYPPQGADMQAWVVDGSKTIVVAKGDLLNGARVLRVEPDRVVTAAGTVR